jgi:alkylation response protein AidB-like acyl-CoA dehydrogenase
MAERTTPRTRRTARGGTSTPTHNGGRADERQPDGEARSNLLTTTDPDLRAALRTIIPQIAAARPGLDTTGRLPDDLVQALADAGMFRLTLPRSIGGPEVDPTTWLMVLEDLSYADGAVGWVTAIADGTAAAVVGGLTEPAVRALYGHDPRVVTCGAIGVMGGQATPVPGGYRVSGRWPFGSGCLHSTYLASLCTVQQPRDDGDGSGPHRGGDGDSELCVVVVPAGEVTILDTCHVVGLRGTGSNDYTLTDVFVPAERAYNPRAPKQHPGPLYAQRFYLFAHAAHALGIARRAIDELTDLASTKRLGQPDQRLRDRGLVQVDVTEAEALVGSARAYLYDVVRDVWETVTAGRNLSDEQRAPARLSMVTGVRNAAAAVDRMYGAAGASSIYESNPLARCFRDIHTATQHSMVGRPAYENIGKILLGITPPNPQVAVF